MECWRNQDSIKTTAGKAALNLWVIVVVSQQMVLRLCLGVADGVVKKSDIASRGEMVGDAMDERVTPISDDQHLPFEAE